MTTSRLPPAISPSAPFSRVIGRETPRKENITDAISAITTTIAMIRLIWLARAIAAAASSFEDWHALLRDMPTCASISVAGLLDDI